MRKIKKRGTGMRFKFSALAEIVFQESFYIMLAVVSVIGSIYQIPSGCLETRRKFM